MLSNKEQESIRHYLLGQAPAEELPQLEERLLMDQAFYEELLIIEDELIDEYLSNELSATEQKSFETHFLLAPERKHKMRFARTLNRYVAGAKEIPAEEPLVENLSERESDVPKPPAKPWYAKFFPSQNPVLSYSLAAALVLIVGTVSWIAWKKLRNPAPNEPGRLLAVALNPGVTRGEGGVKRIEVTPDIGSVEFRLHLSHENYTNYDVALLRDGVSEVWTTDHLPVVNEGGAQFVSASIPARFLSPGDYKLKLSGKNANGPPEELPSYRVRVVR